MDSTIREPAAVNSEYSDQIGKNLLCNGVMLWSRLFYLCSIIFTLAFANVQPTTAQIMAPWEVDALKAIKGRLIDSQGHLNSWNRGDPCMGNWSRVICYNETASDGYLHVQELQLLQLNLRGTLAPELGQLSHMKIMDFMWNSISGSIPKEVGNITSLKLLLLNGNQLTGSLPEEIGFLPNLDRIQIDQNHISGPIPKSFAYLNKTKHFHMNNNSLSGQIPPELSRLPSLVHLLLDNNNLSGYLPPELSKLPKLLIIQLDNNNFSGSSIPSSYGNITTLLKLSLRNCSLEGPVPDVSGIPQLGYLDLSWNQLRGPIPSGQLASNITTIDVSHNHLNGSIPRTFSGLPNIQRLSLDNNNLDGSVPSDVWQNIDFNGNRSLILDFRNNSLTNLSNPLLPPANVTILLSGNPVCTSQNQPNISQYCQSNPVVALAPGGSANNSTICQPCSTDLPYENIPMSPIPCLCAIPLYVDYRLKSPGFWDFVPYEVQFQQYLSSGLSLSLYQLEVSTFMWEEGPRLRMYLKLFPNNTALFNTSEVSRLRDMFTGWLIADSDIFGPYELLNFNPGWYNNILQRPKSSLSTGAIVGVVVAAFVVAAILSSIITLIILRRRSKHSSKKRSAKRIPMKIDGVKDFTFEELSHGTNEFGDSALIGQGGYGKVYRGLLSLFHALARFNLRPRPPTSAAVQHLADDGRRRRHHSPMTPASVLLLAVLFLLLAAPASASTLAVSGGSTVCAVAVQNGTVYCAALSAPNASSPVAPFVTFSQVSGGAGFVCGLRAGGTAFFCWPPAAPGQLRRVYNGPDALADLAVGSNQVAAYEERALRIRWWRGGNRFPQQVDGSFRSLVSGDDFSCALETNSSAVRCWGPRGSAVQATFSNASVSSLAAGGTHACGVLTSGAVLCSGSGAGALAPRALYLHGLAVGDFHACGLMRPNHTAVCWNLAGPTTTLYSPAFGTAFEYLVAGGNLTCGLVTTKFSVMCWSSSTTDFVAAEVSLPTILPGVCVLNESSCECGVFPRSELLCAYSGGGVICKSLCDMSPPPAPLSPPPSSPPPPAPSRGVSKGWIAFGVVGAVGAFAGLCSIVYCFVFGFCSHKKVHNSVQPNIAGGTGNTAGGAGNTAAAADNGGFPSPYGSPNGSRSRGLFRRQLSRVMTRQRSGPSSFKDPAEVFTFAQLAAATKDFALEAKIGEGSFGTVYRGKLPDGREVAIKRGESGPRARKFQEKESAFRSELAFLSRLHHKHLVGLVGYCEENDERMLVYEYMKNGALYDHLHPKATGASSSSPVVSSWKLRIKILLDASRGIEYLHSYAVPPIIHRDIKSSNILLDGSWVARVSDFGLSLMGPETEEAHLSMNAAGTVGYMDPEYYGLHHLTVKSDVYGFGVVMLEALTGKRAIFKEAEGGSPVSVVDYAQASIVAGELGKVLDGRAPEPAAHEAEAVELVAYTAVHCVRLEGKDRPAMADIVANLETAFALCEGSAGGGVGGLANSSSSASLSIKSMELA